MEKPLATIVIPTCERPNLLSNCLALLVPQLPEDGSVEILVCDDGITADSKQIVFEHFPAVSWHKGPARGPASNRNFGARCARGSWIIFLDDDCEPRSSFVATYLNEIASASRQVMVLEGATFSADQMPSLLCEAPHNPRGGMLISCNFATPRELFVKMNGFDERFPMAAFEDTEFHARVIEQGIPIRFVAGAAVDHPIRQIPAIRKMAMRWEARVIYARDLGATRWDVVKLLPLHVFKVIYSRMRKCRVTVRNIYAGWLFTCEFLLVLWFLPKWVATWYSKPRSEFWVARRGGATIPRRFGF